jgi:asparagine synthase (glutamine-hydrolysing)
MCGISGAIELKDFAKIDFSRDSFAHKSIARRGPDSYSYKSLDYERYKITLAHSRLSIIDLSAASNQPFYSQDKRYVVVFNGEIYNYIELRQELKSYGVQFETQGDTEVLLYSWIYWGSACLNKFNGMFSFAIYDSQKGELNLVRDRFGVKPLVYSFLSNGGVFFSSSIDSVSVHSNNVKLDMDYLSRGYHYGIFEGVGDNTSYESVKYLEAGTIATISLLDGLKFSLNKWYDLKTEVEKKLELNASKSYDQLKEECHFLLKDSVRLRLRSDVPVAVSLSGGVDSTIIASIANSINSNIEGFSFGGPLDISSEGALVDLFSKKTGINVNYISIKETKETVIKAFEDTFEAQELPFLGLSIVAQNQVYKRVREKGIRVLLGGQGGDEIFAGYRKFFIHSLKNSIHNKELLTSTSLMMSLGNMLIYEAKKFSLFWGYRNRYFGNENSNVKEFGFLPFTKLDMIGDATMTIADRQILDVLQTSIPTLLRYEDRNSMYHSIESRLPMMDYRLVEYAISLPILSKIRNGFGKWILRDVFRNEVPNEILFNKRKRGFDVTQNLMKLGLQDYLINNIMENNSKFAKFNFSVSFQDISKIKLKSEHLKNNDLLFLNYLIRKI